MNKKSSSPSILKKFSAGLLVLAAILSLPGCNEPTALELSGTVESTQLECNAEAAGKIIRLFAEEGSYVKEGDILAELDPSLQVLAVRQQEAVVTLKQARLDELNAGTRPEQLKQAEAAEKTAETAVNNARTDVSTATTTYEYWLSKYENIKTLSEAGSASDNDLQDAKYRLDTSKQQLETAGEQLDAARSQLKSAQAQLELLKNGSTSQSIQAAEADVQQARAALDQALLMLERHKIKAPAGGTLLLVNTQLGDMVNVGTGIGTISDLKKLWLNVYIPQRHLESIMLGQQLDLGIQALPDRTVKGKITYISHQAEFTPKNIETEEAKENTVFRVKIEILDKPESLKPGMTANAIIPTVTH